jgi:hypothetical protein
MSVHTDGKPKDRHVADTGIEIVRSLDTNDIVCMTPRLRPAAGQRLVDVVCAIRCSTLAGHTARDAMAGMPDEVAR